MPHHSRAPPPAAYVRRDCSQARQAQLELRRSQSRPRGAVVARDGLLHPPRRLVFRFQPSRTSAGEILSAVREAGLEIADLTTEEADLEAIFLRLTQSDSNGDSELGIRDVGDPQAGPLSVSRTRPAP